MNDTAKLPFLACLLVCCLLSASQHVPSSWLEILPGQILITFYICLSAFLETRSWWKVRRCFAYALYWHMSWQFWTWLVHRSQRQPQSEDTWYGNLSPSHSAWCFGYHRIDPTCIIQPPWTCAISLTLGRISFNYWASYCRITLRRGVGLWNSKGMYVWWCHSETKHLWQSSAGPILIAWE